MKRGKSICDVALISVFFGIIALIGFSILLLPPKSFSQRENRPLAARPQISFEAVSNGEYFKQLGDFYSDQLPFKEGFGNVYSLCELALGKGEVNGILLCSNRALAARADQSDPSVLKRNLDCIDSLAAKRGNFLLFIPPSSRQVFARYLPNSLIGAESLPESDFFKTVSRDPTKYYYLTDHHWTSEGAYEAYVCLCASLGISPYPEQYFKKESVSESFYGSAFRQSALPRPLITPDRITLYRYENDQNLMVYNSETGVCRQGLYDHVAIADSDPYNVFLGGNFAHLSIYKKSKEPRPRMLLIKDSFANSLAPFLAIHYDIEMIDPRYADVSLLASLPSPESFDAILLLCSAHTLASESRYGLFVNYLLPLDKE